MKKASIILLLLCYLMPSIGMSVSVHYCGGKLASVSLMGSAEGRCACGKKPMKKNCCKDKTTTFKIKCSQDLCEQTFVHGDKRFKHLPIVFSTIYLNYISVFSHQRIPFDHPPPLQKEQTIYLLNGVFLI